MQKFFTMFTTVLLVAYQSFAFESTHESIPSVSLPNYHIGSRTLIIILVFCAISLVVYAILLIRRKAKEDDTEISENLANCAKGNKREA